MRSFGVLFATSAVACLVTTHVFGQSAEQRPAEEQFEPYHKHHDTHLGHDHFYPDRGSIVREAPQGAIAVNYAGLSYRFHDGVWYEPRGPAFMVVAPPIGLVVPTLPTFTTVWAHGGEVYLYCNDVYYQPRPDLGGYEIVNDPTAEPVSKSKAAVAAVVPGAVVPGAAAGLGTATSGAMVPGASAPGVVASSAMVPGTTVPGAAASGAVASGVAATTAGPAAAAMAPKPAGAQVAAGTAPAVDPDEVPPTVVPYTVPSATAAPAPGSAVRLAAKMTPDVMPAPATSSAIAPAAVPAVATTTASLAPGAAATAATVPVLAAATATNTAPGAATYTPASAPAPTAVPATYAPAPAPAMAIAPTPTIATVPAVAIATQPAASSNLPAAAIPTSATVPVTLPATSSSGSPTAPPKGVRADVVPRNGQGPEQLARDRYECYQFAVKQSGYDPIHSGGAAVAQQQYDYDRAQSGCFDARGYTVR
jgi:uncharacterized protein DUF6515